MFGEFRSRGAFLSPNFVLKKFFLGHFQNNLIFSTKIGNLLVNWPIYQKINEFTSKLASSLINKCNSRTYFNIPIENTFAWALNKSHLFESIPSSFVFSHRFLHRIKLSIKSIEILLFLTKIYFISCFVHLMVQLL